VSASVQLKLPLIRDADAQLTVRRQLTSVPSPASAASEKSSRPLMYGSHEIQFVSPMTGSPPTN
jgi:hypothetical protein